METGRTNEFCKGAMRIVLTSKLARKQIVDDLGVRMSSLNKGITAHRGVVARRWWKFEGGVISG